ncbi:MAG: host nuclease inhibitor protein [Pseudomonadota bacterium]
MKAFAYASGEIVFASDRPEGTLPIASGPERVLKNFISVRARHAYDGETLLVPGVPEANNERDRFEALRRWGEWLATRHPGNVKVFWYPSPKTATAAQAEG